MDNILKLIVGCLGLVGLIVMIVPNSDPLASTNDSPNGAVDIGVQPNQAVSIAPPPLPSAQVADPEGQKSQSEFIVEDYDINSFGQPMVDPTPPAQRALIAQQQSEQVTNQQSGSQGDAPAAGSQGQSGTIAPRPLPPIPAEQ